MAFRSQSQRRAVMARIWSGIKHVGSTRLWTGKPGFRGWARSGRKGIEPQNPIAWGVTSGLMSGAVVGQGLASKYSYKNAAMFTRSGKRFVTEAKLFREPARLGMARSAFREAAEERVLGHAQLGVAALSGVAALGLGVRAYQAYKGDKKRGRRIF